MRRPPERVKIEDILKVLADKARENAIEGPPREPGERRPGETGWSELGPVRCSFYPDSRRYRWWLKDGPTSYAEAIESMRTSAWWTKRW